MCMLHNYVTIQILDQVSGNVGEAQSFAAQNNIAKNRSTDFLPGYYSQMCTRLIYDLCYSLLCQNTVDKWRVVLKGENPDYIHATNIRVSTYAISVSIGRQVGVVCL